jgi:hypothetical protein
MFKLAFLGAGASELGSCLEDMELNLARKHIADGTLELSWIGNE